MANPYLSTDDRAAAVQRLFGTIAARYDLINDLQSFGLHRLWKKRLVRLSDFKPGQNALDVCCGTGDIAFALAARGGEVTGLDFNEPMLRRAEERLHASKHSHALELIQGDAMELPFANNSFDVVTVGYGLRNLADWRRGIDEMVRVARPGGKILSLEFGKPRYTLWREFYFAYLRLAVPVLGKLFAGSSAAYGYILDSLRVFPDQETLANAFGHAGCGNVRTINLLGGVMAIHSAAKARR